MESIAVSSPPLSSSPVTSASPMTPIDTPLNLSEQIDLSVINFSKPTKLNNPSTRNTTPYRSLSPRSDLSLSQAQTEDMPLPPDEREDLSYKPGVKLSTASLSRAKMMRDRMLKKHLPYPSAKMSNAAPLELRFAARFLGRGSRPEFTIEAMKKHEDKLDRGLTTMSNSTLRKAFRAKQASREAARMRLLTTAWEIEEAERFAAFLGALHLENKQQLNLASDELDGLRRILSTRSREEVDDDADYFQAIYDDELEALQLATAHTEKVAELLNSRGQAVPGEIAGASAAQTSTFEESSSDVDGSPAEHMDEASTFEVSDRVTARGPFDVDDSPVEDTDEDD